MGRRITRKQLKQDDEFVSAGELVFRWIVDNLRPLLAGVAALAVLALAWWGATAWLGARADEASLMLSRAVAEFEGEDAVNTGVPSGDIETAEASLEQVVESYGSTDQADMARLYLARIALQRGQVDEARSAFVELAERHADNLIGRLATLDLIDLRLASGQGAEVAAELEAMVVGNEPALPRDTALYKLGELFASEGEPDRARPYFERLLEEFPESPYQMNARQKLSELG